MYAEKSKARKCYVINCMTNIGQVPGLMRGDLSWRRRDGNVSWSDRCLLPPPASDPHLTPPLIRSGTYSSPVTMQPMMHLVSLPPPPVDRMTDTCENITFARFATWQVIRLICNIINNDH